MHSVAMAIVIETCAYHGHSLYYQATVLAIVIYCLRLLNVAMAMVVMGDTCVQSIIAICTIMLLCW